MWPLRQAARHRQSEMRAGVIGSRRRSLRCAQRATPCLRPRRSQRRHPGSCRSRSRWSICQYRRRELVKFAFEARPAALLTCRTCLISGQCSSIARLTPDNECQVEAEQPSQLPRKRTSTLSGGTKATSSTSPPCAASMGRTEAKARFEPFLLAWLDQTMIAQTP